MYVYLYLYMLCITFQKKLLVRIEKYVGRRTMGTSVISSTIQCPFTLKSITLIHWLAFTYLCSVLITCDGLTIS